ncbi:hypothetical protein ACOSQ4_032305 [Xanthoceras sorbifolium]
MFVSLEGCLEEERVALLQLKHFFNDPHSLRDWVEGERNTDCCQWESVKCNRSTGRVTELYLYSTRNRDLGEWYLNASLFSTFLELELLQLKNNTKLEYLDLTNNSLGGIVAADYKIKNILLLSKASNLEGLYLSANNLSGRIPNSFFNSSFLLILDLMPIQLCQLDQLRLVDLSHNNLSGHILPCLDMTSLHENGNILKQIESLDISYNNLIGKIPGQLVD